MCGVALPDAKGINIGLHFVVGAEFQLRAVHSTKDFRGSVPWGDSKDVQQGALLDGVIHNPADPKVAELDPERILGRGGLLKEDVFCLDVAVDDALRVCGHHRVCNLEDKSHQKVELQVQRVCLKVTLRVNERVQVADIERDDDAAWAFRKTNEPGHIRVRPQRATHETQNGK